MPAVFGVVEPVRLSYGGASRARYIRAKPVPTAWRVTEADVRGLTPLVWGHVSPYGAFDLDMEQRLDLELREAA